MWVTAGVACGLILLGFVISFTPQTSNEAPSSEAGERRAEQEVQNCLSFFTGLPAEEIDRDYPQLAGLRGAELETAVRRTMCNFSFDNFGVDDKRFFATELLGDNYMLEEGVAWADQRPDSSRPQTSSFGSTTIREASEGMSGILPALATFSLVLSVIIGASFVGAEYKSGTVENLLLWEPRRARVLTAKFLAGFASSTVVTAVVLAWLVAIFYFLAIVHGTTSGVDSRFWIDIASVIIRAGIAGGLFFVMAMSVAVIARNTTASVGLILGWFAVSNIVIELFGRRFRRWELFTNALAFITEANVPRYTRVFTEWRITYGHDYLVGGLIVVVWAFVMASVATWLFVRRDVD